MSILVSFYRHKNSKKYKIFASLAFFSLVLCERVQGEQEKNNENLSFFEDNSSESLGNDEIPLGEKKEDSSEENIYGQDEFSEEEKNHVYVLEDTGKSPSSSEEEKQQWLEKKKQELEVYKFYKKKCKEECEDILFYVLPMAAYTGNVWHSYRTLKVLCLIFFIDRWQEEVLEKKENQRKLRDGKFSLQHYIRYKERFHFYSFVYALLKNHHIMMKQSDRPLVDLFSSRDYPK